MSHEQMRDEGATLSRRIDAYINLPSSCPVATGLLIEQRKHLAAANQGAERNMHVAIRFLNKFDEVQKTIMQYQPLVEAANEACAEYEESGKLPYGAYSDLKIALATLE